MMDDPTRDVQVVNTPDVTQSSYAEQDRLNVDFDEISGNFSQSTVQTNRSLNETVGGMEMLSAGANQQMEYMLRTFAETWVEPVLRQLVRLEQYYETDDVIMSVAVNAAAQEQEEMEGEATIYTRFGEDEDTDDLLRHEMTVAVNVGIGATDPVKKIDRLLLGIRTMAEIDPNIISIIDQKEVSKEVFGALGYKDSQRFFSEEQAPMIEELASKLIKYATNGLYKVYFGGTSGSDAIDAAMKLSYQIHHDTGKKNKKFYISRVQSFNGATLHAMAVSDLPILKIYDPLLPKNVVKLSLIHI